MLTCYGYIPIFYSRRKLVSNYLEQIKEKKEDVMYYIKAKDERYPIIEEKDGTTIYSKEPLNLINELDNIDIDYVVMNAFNIKEELFMKQLNNYLNNKKEKENTYTGFINKKTVYDIKDYE